MTLKLKSTTNELWKGWNPVWYHLITHIACAKKLRGLRQKLDALRVQTGPSPSKYKGFGRKLICFKGISFFETYFNFRLFVHSICNIQNRILKFQPFLTSFVLLFNLNYFQMSQIRNSTGSSWNIVQSSLKVRYLDLVDFSGQFLYINLFHIIYGLKDMNFQNFRIFLVFSFKINKFLSLKINN